ncbi:MAG TPA: exonuclease domain-containing protein [Longimicrobiales bacterium]|nr:exonuclease domain-containing protein [Longimicrobiales bacterium]
MVTRDGARRIDVARSVQLSLPLELKVDASDAKRRGIRISLDTLAVAAARRARGVDCAGGMLDDACLRELEYAVVDVETTGGGWSRGHRITEIAALRVRGDGTIVDEYRSLVNPERPIPYFISVLTNITGEMVRDAPRFADVAQHVARVLGGAVFVAHNAGFDWNFVGAEMDRAGVPVTGRTLCTVRLARKVVPELRSRSLDSLTGFFNIPVEGRHRAYGDARATTELFRRLLDRLDGMEVTRWHELQTLLTRRVKKRKRLANPHSMTEPVE